jgi:hypothetical protein
MQDDKNKKLKEDSKSDNMQASSVAKYLLAIIIVAIIGFYSGSLYKSKNIQISYISQGEILVLEKERLSTQNIKDRQLFFGKPENAIKHIEQIQKDMSKNGVIILLTDSKIYGSKIASISKEVHLQIIERLSEGKK